jgi:CheY-like chemotaxis protein
VQVQDDGIGVSEAAWRKSSGIGNRIVLAMAEKIGGALSIDSGAFGTSVTVSFAADDPAPDAETVRDTETSILVVAESLGRDRRGMPDLVIAPPRLLLVEDDALMRLMVANNLEAAGFIVEEAGSGAEARQLWHVGRYAAAMIDIGLPDCRGDQVASEFRNADPHFPIVLASGYDEKTIAAGFLGSRFSRVLVKPYDEVAMLAALDALGVRAAQPVLTQERPISRPV